MFTIVIPTYNEKDNLPKLVEKIIRISKNKANILIVDDNSPDGTGDVAEKLKRKYKKITVLHRKQKTGLGSAILDGFRNCKTDIIGVIDADLSHPPELIPEMIKAIDSKEIVIASRYAEGGGTSENWSSFRLLVSKSAIILTKPLTGVRDPMSGFFFTRKKLIDKANLEPVSCKICLEILVKCKIKDFKEVPYIFINRESGESKILNRTEISNYIKHLFKLYIYKVKNSVG